MPPLRSYQYHTNFNKDPCVYSWLKVRCAWSGKPMNQVAAIIMEYTDFSCFSKIQQCKKPIIVKCRMGKTEQGNSIFRPTGFTRNMVRALLLAPLGDGWRKHEMATRSCTRNHWSARTGAMPVRLRYSAWVVFNVEAKYPFFVHRVKLVAEQDQTHLPLLNNHPILHSCINLFYLDICEKTCVLIL